MDVELDRHALSSGRAERAHSVPFRRLRSTVFRRVELSDGWPGTVAVQKFGRTGKSRNRTLPRSGAKTYRRPGAERSFAPIHATVASCSTPSRRGLISASARRTHGATASLDHVSTRGHWQSMGRDEETGYQVEQRNKPFLPVSLFDRRRFFVPTCPCQDARRRRRQGWPSRRRPHMLAASPGRALTAASTASSWLRSGFARFC